MSNKHIVDPLLIDLTRHCTRLDWLSNDLHAAIRNKRAPSFDMEGLVEDVAKTATTCGDILREPAVKKSAPDGSILAVSFALRAAHEALEAFVAYNHLASNDQAAGPDGIISSDPAPS